MHTDWRTPWEKSCLAFRYHWMDLSLTKMMASQRSSPGWEVQWNISLKSRAISCQDFAQKGPDVTRLCEPRVAKRNLRCETEERKYLWMSEQGGFLCNTITHQLPNEAGMRVGMLACAYWECSFVGWACSSHWKRT